MNEAAIEDGEARSQEAELALAYTPARLRPALMAFFLFDRRLGRLVASTTEPMLGQMRLAWWREALERPVTERPKGDAVLDALGESMAGHEDALISLVDGWEHLLGDQPLSDEEARAFAKGRHTVLAALYQSEEASARQKTSIEVAGHKWACADLAAKVSRQDDRDLLISLGLEADTNKARLPRAARGLAVLAALAKRSMKRGARPLLEGRGAALVALRAGLIGS